MSPVVNEDVPHHDVPITIKLALTTKTSHDKVETVRRHYLQMVILWALYEEIVLTLMIGICRQNALI